MSDTIDPLEIGVEEARSADCGPVGGPRVLLAEASLSQAKTLVDGLVRAGMTVTTVVTGEDALRSVLEDGFDLAVVSATLPGIDLPAMLARLRDPAFAVPVIVLAADGSLAAAVKAIRAGAYDYIVKPFSIARLVAVARSALADPSCCSCVTACKTVKPPCGDGFIGDSPAMWAVRQTIAAVAVSKAPIFITGETGTGKEVCAQAIHRASGRAGGPFVAINCAAIPRDLAESELFGHVKGAFTGAVANRAGAAARAHQGTLLLDEIGEMDLDLQAKLLRFLQTGMVQRLGAAGAEAMDVRVICATNRDPLAEIAAGRFREDLYYRLHVVPVHLPPLRERGGDALEIAQALLHDYAREERKRFVRLAPCATAAIAAYDWPGNVRELQNALRSAVVLNEAEELTAAMLPEHVAARAALPIPDAHEPAAESAGSVSLDAAPASPKSDPHGSPPIAPLAQVERDAIEAAIRLCGNNIARAAKALGVSPSTLYRKRQT